MLLLLVVGVILQLSGHLLALMQLDWRLHPRLLPIGVMIGTLARLLTLLTFEVHCKWCCLYWNDLMKIKTLYYRSVQFSVDFIPCDAMYSIDFSVKDACLSICMSRRNSFEMAKRISKLIPQLASHTILDFIIPNITAIFRRGLLTGALNAGVVGKDWDFWPVSGFGIDNW